jgi:murein DD-endopeptidase MepM/ murein hydrolase activator NlpD
MPVRLRRLLPCLSVLFPCAVLLISCHGGDAVRRSAAGGIYHRVQPGQTLWSIAEAYEIDLHDLRRTNRLSKSAVIRSGQKLFIPGAQRTLHVASRCPCDPDAARSQPQTSVSRPSSDSRAADEKQTARFAWPLQGPIMRQFQPRGPRRHDGIDISASKGTPIRAAADGRVIFSDWGPGGYGRLVIIQHADNLVTVYAHNHENLVRTDQSVQRGDIIASVGRSGRATAYHLHFEVRRKTVPVSPLQFLSPNRHVARVVS